MSFRCEGCGETTAPGKPANKMVTKVRKKTREWGTEIVEEKNVCESCFDAELEPQLINPEPTLDAVGNPVFLEAAQSFSARE